MRYLTVVIMIFSCCMVMAADFHKELLTNIFPIEHYNQSVDYWINSSESNYNQLLLPLAIQNKQFEVFKHRYFGTKDNDYSPWSPNYVKQILSQSSDIRDIEVGFLAKFDNTKIYDNNKINYGINKRPYSDNWIRHLRDEVNLSQFGVIKYNQNNRAIMIDNASMRILPTHDASFYNDKIPGEGFPFDNLINSAIYVGTPVYIIGKSLDKSWYIVISPSLIGWVPANKIALVDENFIYNWQK